MIRAERDGPYMVGVRCHGTFYGARMAATRLVVPVWKDREKVWIPPALSRRWRREKAKKKRSAATPLGV